MSEAESTTPETPTTPVGHRALGEVVAPEEFDAVDRTIRNARAAGALSLLMSVVTLVVAVQGRVDTSAPLLGPSFLIDVCLAAALVAGQLKVTKWFLLRTVVGSLIFGVASLAKGELAELIYQWLWAGVMVSLLVGTPGKVRFRLSLGLGTALLLLGMVGTVISATGVGDGLGEREAPSNGVVGGRFSPYEFKAHTSAWKVRAPEAYAEEAPGIDQWLVDDVADRHVLTVCVEVEEGTTREEVVAWAHSERNSMVEGTSLVSRGEVPSPAPTVSGVVMSRVLREEFTGAEVNAFLDVVAGERTACRLWAVAPPSDWTHHRQALLTLMDSFRFTANDPPTPRPAVSAPTSATDEDDQNEDNNENADGTP